MNYAITSGVTFTKFGSLFKSIGLALVLYFIPQIYPKEKLDPNIQEMFSIAASIDTLDQRTGSMEPLPELKRGLNVFYYDPGWGELDPLSPGSTRQARWRFQKQHFEEIRRGGFDFIRVNLRTFRHMIVDYDFYTMDAEYHCCRPSFLEVVDWIVESATQAGLSVILDVHDYELCGENADACHQRLLAFWSNVAERYRDAPPSVLFELLNEPVGKMDADTWNAVFPEILALVRQGNPTRRVVIGPSRYRNYNMLPTLKLPEDDPNIIATFHYYNPAQFTMQGNRFVSTETGVSWGSEADHSRIAEHFNEVAEWSRATGFRVLLGEFGVVADVGIPVYMRADYIDAVAREAERHGFAWAFFEFSESPDPGREPSHLVWDMEKDAWVAPIHRALIPEK